MGEKEKHNMINYVYLESCEKFYAVYERLKIFPLACAGVCVYDGCISITFAKDCSQNGVENNKKYRPLIPPAFNE